MYMDVQVSGMLWMAQSDHLALDVLWKRWFNVRMAHATFHAERGNEVLREGVENTCARPTLQKIKEVKRTVGWPQLERLCTVLDLNFLLSIADRKLPMWSGKYKNYGQ